MILGTLHLDGPPVPKGRPKFAQLPGGGVRTYTPQATVAYEQQIALAWRGPRLFTGPVKVTIAVIEGVTAHPADLDNFIKLLDALNGIAWVDDKQIIAIDAKIHRGDPRPGLDVIVEGWEAEAPPPKVAPMPRALQLRRGRGR